MTAEPMKLDPRIRRTRQMLFKAFQDLLTEKTFQLITVQDIAERSTLNRATFYDHFTDKFALLEAMIGERFQTLIAARIAGNEGTCEESLRQLILAACDFLAEVSSGCQKHQRQFEPMVESQVKAVILRIIVDRPAESWSRKSGTEGHDGQLGDYRCGTPVEPRKKNLSGRARGCRSADSAHRIAGGRMTIPAGFHATL